MKFNWDFDIKWSPELKSTLLNAFIGGGVGLASSFLSSGKLALAMMLVFAWATGQAIQKFTKWQPKVTQADGTEKQEIKWWLGNGLYPFSIFWVFCWVLFYNIL
ncbi:MAG: hypothetical protein ABIF92_01775 [archaeon]